MCVIKPYFKKKTIPRLWIYYWLYLTTSAAGFLKGKDSNAQFQPRVVRKNASCVYIYRYFRWQVCLSPSIMGSSFCPWFLSNSFDGLGSLTDRSEIFGPEPMALTSAFTSWRGERMRKVPTEIGRIGSRLEGCKDSRFEVWHRLIRLDRFASLNLTSQEDPKGSNPMTLSL